MRGNYKQVPVFNASTRFDKAPQSGVERSRMSEPPRVITAFNAGDLVPLRAIEILTSETYSCRVEDIIRQMTLKTPTMGEMICDVYAFFVPNRIVNRSWVNVQGENSSGAWSAPEITLAPLYTGSSAVQIPVGSVADFYGIPTQKPMPASVLALMNDLPFRGYLAIYNEYFRDQNYIPPIPFSKNNVYEGFLLPVDTEASLGPSNGPVSLVRGIESDGRFPQGSLVKEIYGEGSSTNLFSGSGSDSSYLPSRRTSWSALDAPLKTCKLHDPMTSVLPSPQKGPSVTFSLEDTAPVEIPMNRGISIRGGNAMNNRYLQFYTVAGAGGISDGGDARFDRHDSGQGYGLAGTNSDGSGGLVEIGSLGGYLGNDLKGTADLSDVLSLSIDDLRLGFAMQQLYELYGRSGSRYRELCHALFGIDVDDPFSDIPRLLGRFTFPLELYQTAQTSASSETSPQGNLAAFGYTNKNGFLFNYTFLEHGYLHLLCTVRQRNTYSSYLDPHWFRVNKLDFYTPILANISEQPVLLRTINPFGENPNSTVFGYQEAWWEYRQHPDIVTGFMRSGISNGSLSSWTYQDIFVEGLSSADADFMESNAQEVLDNTLAVSSENAPQFKALFTFYFEHEFPGPVYSVPGLDVI